MDIHKGYKFRFYPTTEQEDLLARSFGCARKVYNDGLELKSRAYSEARQNISFADLWFLHTLDKHREELAFFTEVPSVVIQQSLRDLDTAYQRFFRKQSKYPKFKSKHDVQSIRFPTNGFKYDGRNSLTLARMSSPLSIKWSRTIPRAAKVKSVTISKDKSNRYFVSFLCLDSVSTKAAVESNIGIDFGLKDFITLSTGEKVTSPKFYRKAEDKLKRLQKHHSKKRSGSQNKEKARLKLARAYAKAADARRDFLHKLSSKLVNENQVICIEDLSMKNMSKNRKLAKSIFDSGWYEFTRQLEYKASWYGRTVQKVGRFYPSSKTCSHCGTIKPQLSLSDRNWVCSDCGTEHDRDVNAALNVLAEGLSVLACGEESSGSRV